MPDNKTDAIVRILDIIPVDSVKGNTPDIFDTFPMYEYLSNGVIRINPGFKRKGAILFYDVSSASEEFKNDHREMIIELDVSKILNPLQERDEKDDVSLGNRITTIMSLTGVYKDLNKDEISSLGKDFVVVTATEQGIKVGAVIRAKSLPDNLYLRFDPSIVEQPLLDKISSDTTELERLDSGLYREVGSPTREKMITLDKTGNE